MLGFVPCGGHVQRSRKRVSYVSAYRARRRATARTSNRSTRISRGPLKVDWSAGGPTGLAPPEGGCSLAALRPRLSPGFALFSGRICQLAFKSDYRA